MKDTIDQFMWGFQQHFRRGVERDVTRTLSKIGLPVDVRVVLVGFATRLDKHHLVCVEPEDGPFGVEHLSNVVVRASEILTADPESGMIVSNPRLRQLREQSLTRTSRAQAVAEAIETSGALPGLTFFVSSSTPIAGYEVHTCVGVPSEAFASAPALRDDIVDRVYVGRSLQHEVIAECLAKADAALCHPEPGADLYVLGVTADEIARTAAKRFVDGIVYRLTERQADFFQSVNAFVSLGYERAPAGGRLVIQRTGEDDELPVRFEDPIRLGDARIMRKLLELTDDAMSIISDGGLAYGLGRAGQSPGIAEIVVLDHAQWQVSIDGIPLVRVAYGEPSLPKPFLGKARFHDIALRVVGDIELDRIWSIVEAAQAAGHGTTIVVSTQPSEEASRLGGQAVPIVPSLLDSHEVVRLGRVDGALLLGTDSRCHAFGVILDGIAEGGGDPARGSRFNSAVRYQRTGPPALVIVVSDDGTIDVLPSLLPRVRREDVESAVLRFESICEQPEVDGERFGEAHDRVMRLSFYLSENQCQRVIAAYESEMDRRLSAGGMAVSAPPLRPNPDMSDSYFLL